MIRVGAALTTIVEEATRIIYTVAPVRLGVRGKIEFNQISDPLFLVCSCKGNQIISSDKTNHEYMLRISIPAPLTNVTNPQQSPNHAGGNNKGIWPTTQVSFGRVGGMCLSAVKRDTLYVADSGREEDGFTYSPAIYTITKCEWEDVKRGAKNPSETILLRNTTSTQLQAPYSICTGGRRGNWKHMEWLLISDRGAESLYLAEVSLLENELAIRRKFTDQWTKDIRGMYMDGEFLWIATSDITLRSVVCSLHTALLNENVKTEVTLFESWSIEATHLFDVSGHGGYIWISGTREDGAGVVYRGKTYGKRLSNIEIWAGGREDSSDRERNAADGPVTEVGLSSCFGIANYGTSVFICCRGDYGSVRLVTKREAQAKFMRHIRKAGEAMGMVSRLAEQRDKKHRGLVRGKS